MAVPKTKSTVTNFPATTRKGTLAKDAPSTGSATLTATVAGTIKIGPAANPITVPISTQIPPTTPGEFSFSYKATTVGETTIAVGDFITWAAAQIDPNLNKDDLPASLQALSVAINTLSFDTKGNFEVDVELGKGSGSTWNADWKPIPGLDSFVVSDVSLDVKRTVS